MAEEGVLPAPLAEAPDLFIKIAGLVNLLREEGRHDQAESKPKRANGQLRLPTMPTTKLVKPLCTWM
jgi:hypothetical protein